MESPVKRKVVITSKPKSILEAFENIVELAENSNLDEDFFESAGENIRYASRKLKLNQMQTALLAIFVDRSEDNSIRLSELDSGATSTVKHSTLRLRPAALWKSISPEKPLQ